MTQREGERSRRSSLHDTQPPQQQPQPPQQQPPLIPSGRASHVAEGRENVPPRSTSGLQDGKVAVTERSHKSLEWAAREKGSKQLLPPPPPSSVAPRRPQSSRGSSKASSPTSSVRTTRQQVRDRAYFSPTFSPSATSDAVDEAEGLWLAYRGRFHSTHSLTRSHGSRLGSDSHAAAYYGISCRNAAPLSIA